MLESSDSSGQVILKQYEEDMDLLPRYHTLLDELNQTIISVHQKLDGENTCCCGWMFVSE